VKVPKIDMKNIKSENNPLFMSMDFKD